MIAVVIIVLALVVIGASADEGQWGTAVLFGVIALVLLFAGSVERRDAKAYINRRNYWARGGPDAPERKQN